MATKSKEYSLKMPNSSLQITNTPSQIPNIKYQIQASYLSCSEGRRHSNRATATLNSPVTSTSGELKNYWNYWLTNCGSYPTTDFFVVFVSFNFEVMVMFPVLGLSLSHQQLKASTVVLTPLCLCLHLCLVFVFACVFSLSN